MSQQAIPPSQLQKAVAFFQQAVWTRLMSALYTKYIERGQIRGRIVLSQCTPDEQREIARFLSKPLSPSTDVSVRLTDFQQALKNSFACELPELLWALFPEYVHVTRPQQKELLAQSQQTFGRKLAALIENFPSDSPGRSWLTRGKHGRDALFRQHKNESSSTQEQTLHMLQMVIEALNQLPTPPSFQYLSHFALHISGDPHFFDVNTTSGRLFLSALTDLHELAPAETTTDAEAEHQQESEMNGIEQDHWRHLLYYEAGLLLDTISSTVAAFHLKEAWEKNGQRDTFLVHAGERILVLPLRQLLAWEKLWPFSKHVYVFENPQVFEVIVDRLLRRQTIPTSTKQEKVPILPTLICTAGWPSVAAIRLLSLLIESSPDVQLHYSGDFDLQGLRIARYLLARYPQHCRLWCFDPDAYLTALHDRGAVLGGNEIAGLQNLPEIFSPLVSVMQRERKKAYHEGITERLLEDIYKSK
jgi:uncharacterized protein (TIGR02679 family)